MNNGNIFPTKLEDLSAEILLSIFSFLSLRNIVPTFSALNSRIDSMIECMSGMTHVVRCNDFDAIQILQSFTVQIGRLIVVHSETVNFTSLINLRSLALKYGRCAQFNSIRPEQFPVLEILHINGSESQTFLIKGQIEIKFSIKPLK
jgi:hypothetical protein